MKFFHFLFSRHVRAERTKSSFKPERQGKLVRNRYSPRWLPTTVLTLVCHCMGSVALRADSINWTNADLTNPLKWDTTSTNWSGDLAGRNNNRFVNGDSVLFTGAGLGTIIIQPGGVTPLSTTFNHATGTYTFTGGGVLGGTYSQTGNGIVSFNNSVNQFSSYSVSAGTLLFDAVGTYGIGPINLSGGTLRFGGGQTSGQVFEVNNPINVTAGSVTLRTDRSGANTTRTNLNGLISLSAGTTLNVNRSEISPTATGGLKLAGGNATLTVASGDTFIGDQFIINQNGISEDLGGGRKLTINSATVSSGSLKINAPSSYTGGTDILSGIVNISSNNALGTGMITLGPASGGTLTTTLSLSSSGLSIPNQIVINAGGGNTTISNFSGTNSQLTGDLIMNKDLTLAVEVANTSLTVTGQISGNGRLVVRGSGNPSNNVIYRAVLTNPLNSFGTGQSNSIDLGSGDYSVLSVSADGQLGNPLNGIRLNIGTLEVTSTFVTPRVFTLDAVGGGSIAVTADQQLTLTSPFAGAGYVIKTDAGTLLLTAVQNRTGATMVFGGTLRATNAKSISNGGSVRLHGGILDLRNDSSTNYAHNITVDDASTINVDQAVGGLGVGNTHTLGTLDFQAGGDLTITGDHGYGVNFGSATISGTSGLFNNNAVPLTINSITRNSTSSVTFTVGGISDTIYATNFTQSSTGALTVSKIDPGKVTLIGSSTRTGQTQFRDGILEINHPVGLGTGTLSFSGGQLSYRSDSGGTMPNSVSISGSTNVSNILIEPVTPNSPLNVSLAGIVSGTNAASVISKTGSGQLTLSGTAANTYVGQWTVNSGELLLNKAVTNGAVNGPLVINGGASKLLAADQIADNVIVTVNAGGEFNTNTFTDQISRLVVNGGAVTGSGGSLVLASTNTSTATPTLLMRNASISTKLGLSGVTGGVVVFDSTNNGTAVISNSLDLNTTTTTGINRTFTINDGTAPVDMEISGAITNTTATGITKTGNGTLRLSGNSSNTYAGLTTVSAGTLSLNKTNATAIPGDILINGSTATLANEQNQQIPDTAMVTVTSGAWNLNTNTETIGSLSILAGKIDIASAATTPGRLAITGNILVPLGGVFNINSTGTALFPGQLDLGNTAKTITVDGSSLSINTDLLGSQGFIKEGAGELYLSGNPKSYTGNTVLNSGRLIVGTNLALGNSTLVINGGTIGALNQGIGSLPNSVLINNGFTAGSGSNATAAVLTLSGPVTLAMEPTITLNNSTTVLNGAISGAFGITQTGAGILQLGGTAANTYAGLTTINYGTLELNKSAGVNAVPSNILINGIPNASGVILATVKLLNSQQIPDTSTVTMNNGLLDINGQTEVIGSLNGAGSVSLGSGTLTIGSTNNLSSAYAGIISGTGGITKAGTGLLTLAGLNTYSGPTQITSGSLTLSGNLNSAAITTSSGTTLRIDGGTINAPLGTLRANAGSVVEYKNANVVGYFIRGTGQHNILAGSNNTFTGTTISNGTTISQNGVTTLMNSMNSGVWNNSAVLTWDGGVNTTTGLLNVNNTANLISFENNGVIKINTGATVTNTEGNLGSGGGSQIQIQAGGTLSLLDGTSLELRGALLVNNGIINGPTIVDYGSTAKGIGTYGSVVAKQGGTFAPGNSAGIVTIGSLDASQGGSYTWELDNITSGSIAGIDYDQMIINNGDLILGGTSYLTLDFHLLPANSDPDSLAAFWATDKSWKIIDLTGTATNLGGMNFSLITNPLWDRGTFSTSVGTGANEGDIFLNFVTAIPEPSTYALVLTGMTVLGWSRWRRREK